MRKLKGFIPTTMLAAILAFGTTFAHAGSGLLISDGIGTDDTTTDPTTTDQPCYDATTGGIILNGIILNGIILNGIILNVTDVPPCDPANTTGGLLISD